MTLPPQLIEELTRLARACAKYECFPVVLSGEDATVDSFRAQCSPATILALCDAARAAGALRAEVGRLRAVVAATYDDAELIRADAQYVHAGSERHGVLPDCTPQLVEQVLDRSIAIQKRIAALSEDKP